MTFTQIDGNEDWQIFINFHEDAFAVVRGRLPRGTPDGPVKDPGIINKVQWNDPRIHIFHDVKGPIGERLKKTVYKLPKKGADWTNLVTSMRTGDNEIIMLLCCYPLHTPYERWVEIEKAYSDYVNTATPEIKQG